MLSIIGAGGKARGVAAAGGQAASAPSWASGLTVDTWSSLSTTNSFQSVQAADGGQYGNSGPDSVFTAWSGAAYVSSFGTYGSILHCGAGHLDYYGNEVYCFDLETLTWSSLSEPSGNSGSGPFTNGILSDGTPCMPHTYYYLVARDGKLVLGLRQVSDLPSYTSMISVFDPSAGTWTNSTASTTITTSDGEAIIYDSTRDVVWRVRTDPLRWAKYSFSEDSWTDYTTNTSAYNSGNCHVYVPTKDAVILFPPSGSIFGLDPGSPESPGNNEVFITTSGTAPSFTKGSMAHWSSNLGAIIYYTSRGNTIHTLTPPAGDWKIGTWTWAQRSLSGTSGVHDGSFGTYGKFNVVEYGEITVATVTGDVDGVYRAVRLV